MAHQLIRQLFDQQERHGHDFSDVTIERTPEVVRGLAQHEPVGFISYSTLTDQNVDQIIQREAAYFQQIGRDLEWKLYDYDPPADLAARLVAHGFVPQEEEAFMVLDLNENAALMNQSIPAAIRRITDPEQVADAIAVLNVVWQDDFVALHTRLKTDLQTIPDALSLFIAYADDQPVSTAWTYYQPNSQFAGLWGGSTLPTFRKAGYYSGLLAIRAQEAVQRGRRFLTVDASPMSRPILEKHGFSCVAMITPHLLQVNRE